jgi:hypothetical protein
VGDNGALMWFKVPTLEGKPNYLEAIKTLRPFISAERKRKMDEVSTCVCLLKIGNHCEGVGRTAIVTLCVKVCL